MSGVAGELVTPAAAAAPEVDAVRASVEQSARTWFRAAQRMRESHPQDPFGARLASTVETVAGDILAVAVAASNRRSR